MTKLVAQMNGVELEKVGAMGPFDYTAHVLVHLLDDADTLNAKFLW